MLSAKNLKYDLPASVVVFLVALPLCLGISLASDAPILSGVISGIVGGLIIGFFSGSQTSVSGPAAGLATVVAASIAKLGSFEAFLFAVSVAGLIQLVLGMLKAGRIADFIPSNVIKGLLAAIGIYLILKQIPHAIGFDADVEGDFAFEQPDGENTFSEIFKALNYITPGAIVISGLSLFLLIIWDKTPMKKLKFLPSSLLIVILGVALNSLFVQYFPALAIAPTHLVNLPSMNLQHTEDWLHLPSLSLLSNAKFWLVAFTIAMVASLETLLNIEAVDKIDPHKRVTDPNRELWAQGLGNFAAGFLGGIPITSVIVRSSVNIQSGNKTKLSTLLHGLFMLLSVLFLSPYLNLIPLASLAAILIVIGYKLAKVSLFVEMYKKGWSQLIPFVVTIVAIIGTDLLVGVLLGLGVSILFLLFSNYKRPYFKEENRLATGNVVKIEFQNQVSFLNKASIKEVLWNIPENTKLFLDASYSYYIDQDVLEIIDDFKHVVAPEKNIQLNIVGFKERYGGEFDQMQFLNVIDKATQEKLSSAEVLQILKEGNQRFISGTYTEKYYHHQMSQSSGQQSPMAVVVNCIDSRTSPEIIFDSGLGDFLTIRIAGNIITPEIIGSIKIAVLKLGAKLIVVKGHSNCGAVALAFNDSGNEMVDLISRKIQKAITQCGCSVNTGEPASEEMMEAVVKRNVQNSIAEILEYSPVLKELIAQHKVGIVGAYHDLRTGEVHFDELI